MPADAPAPRVVSVTTEDVAWEVLSLLLSGELSGNDIVLDFTKADWAIVGLSFTGNKFDQTALPSVMKGLVDLQNNFYHAIAYLLKADARTIRLKNEEKDEYELVFKVKRGSSDFEAPIKDTLESLAQPLVRGLGATQKTIIVLFIALCFASTFVVPKYLDHIKETKKDVEDAQTHRSDNEREMGLQQLAAKYADSEAEKFKIFAEALSKSKGACIVNAESNAGFDSVMRQSYRADGLTIQGRSISKDQIKEITKSTRRASEDVRFRALYKVDGVDSTTEYGFSVLLRNIQTGETFNADLEERLSSARYGRVIQRAEWSKSTVSVQISGRRVGGEMRDARIISAYTPQQQRSQD